LDQECLAVVGNYYHDYITGETFPARFSATQNKISDTALAVWRRMGNGFLFYLAKGKA